MHFDLRTLSWGIESASAFGEMAVERVNGLGRVDWRGNVFEVGLEVHSLDDIMVAAGALETWLPPLLTLEFQLPAVVSEIHGEVGGRPFRFQTDALRFDFETATKEGQEERGGRVLDALDNDSVCGSEQMAAALHYYRRACRLRRCGENELEFLAEAMLNLYKALEAVFTKREKTWRQRLEQLGFTGKEINELVLPIKHLRDKLDVGHYGPLTPTLEQWNVVQTFARSAFRTVRRVLRLLCAEVAAGAYSVAVSDHQLRAVEDQEALIQRLAQYVQAHQAGTDATSGSDESVNPGDS